MPLQHEAKAYAFLIRESADDGSDFSNPIADYRVVFLGEDGTWHAKDSSGTVTSLGGAGIAPTLADAAGDTLVASANDTWAKLTKGAAGGAKSMINGAVAWNSGTSFPGSVVTGDRYWRTDHGMEFYYDGTRWLSTQLFSIQLIAANTTPSGLMSFSATTADALRCPVPDKFAGTDIWLERWRTGYNVESGGSALSASHKWVLTIKAYASGSTHATQNIDSGSSAVWLTAGGDINALTGATDGMMSGTWTKTGTPGNLFAYTQILYRIVTT